MTAPQRLWDSVVTFFRKTFRFAVAARAGRSCQSPTEDPSNNEWDLCILRPGGCRQGGGMPKHTNYFIEASYLDIKCKSHNFFH